MWKARKGGVGRGAGWGVGGGVGGLKEAGRRGREEEKDSTRCHFRTRVDLDPFLWTSFLLFFDEDRLTHGNCDEKDD